MKQHPPRQSINVLDFVSKHNQFDYLEVYRRLRTHLEFTNPDAPPHIIGLTSCQPYEAKTTTAINLAFLFAMKYPHTLLIDCDLRIPQIHHYLSFSNQRGLTDWLYGKCDKAHDILHTYTHPRLSHPLYVLTSGTRIPNPAEMLSSRRFQELIHELANQFDYILLDCPPVLSVSDAIPLGHVADGMLFVLSLPDTTRTQAKQAKNLLVQNNVSILGTVLTKVPLNHSPYGYGYYSN